MTNRSKQGKPASVSVTTKQAGDIRSRWDWVEASVWTDRMLTALETGVKGGKWFSLIDKVASKRNLRASFARVKRNDGAPGVDHVTIAQFESDLEKNLERLSEQLRAGQYRPQAVRRAWIRKPGSREMRPLGIPTVRDRVVQGALRHVLEPIFEWIFAEQSYGFRPELGTKDALRQVDDLLKSGATWVVDADWRHYFETISHERLMALVEEKVSDGKVLELIRAYLKQEVLEAMEAWTPERGTPQGAVLSPLLSNLYLDALDHLLVAEGFSLVRYADDFVILCRSEREATRALAVVREWAEGAELELHPEKTQIVDAAQPGGFDFLGYHFERGYRWPRKKSLKKLKDTLRTKTKRTRGESLAVIVADVNRTLRGWWQYFQHSHYTTFKPLDGWLRMRLRSILRKRQRGKKGRARGRDHQRWPNAFFAEAGLFSLERAYESACQSSQR